MFISILSLILLYIHHLDNIGDNTKNKNLSLTNTEYICLTKSTYIYTNKEKNISDLSYYEFLNQGNNMIFEEGFVVSKCLMNLSDKIII